MKETGEIDKSKGKLEGGAVGATGGNTEVIDNGTARRKECTGAKHGGDSVDGEGNERKG